MKKILALILAAVMLLSVVACTKTPDDTNDSKDQPNDTVDSNGNNDEQNDFVIAPDVDKETLGYLYFEKLVEVKTANPSATAADVVAAIMESKLGMAIPGLMNSPMEPDSFLQGVGTDGATFGGFKSAEVLIPMMMGVPFILYVFDLDEGADVKAFVTKVKNEANPSWNICTTAETVTVGACHNSVILAMCQAEIPSSVSGKAEIIEPTLTAGSETETIWNGFKTVMSEWSEPDVYADMVASNLSAAAFTGNVSAVMDIISNDLFLYEIDSFNAATIENGDKIVYIFVVDFGVDVQNWMDYNCSAKEGVNLICGAYNNTVIVMANID